MNHGKIIDYGIVLLTFLIGVGLNWEWPPIIGLLGLVWHIVMPFPVQHLVKAGLLGLALTVMITLIGKDARAEDVLMYSVLLLAIAMFSGVLQAWEESKTPHE